MMMTLTNLINCFHLLENWDQKYPMNLPVFELHLVKQNVVGEWVPLESGSETMTVSVLATTYYVGNNCTQYKDELRTSVVMWHIYLYYVTFMCLPVWSYC